MKVKTIFGQLVWIFKSNIFKRIDYVILFITRLISGLSMGFLNIVRIYQWSSTHLSRVFFFVSPLLFVCLLSACFAAWRSGEFTVAESSLHRHRPPQWRRLFRHLRRIPSSTLFVSPPRCPGLKPVLRFESSIIHIDFLFWSLICVSVWIRWLNNKWLVYAWRLRNAWLQEDGLI